MLDVGTDLWIIMTIIFLIIRPQISIPYGSVVFSSSDIHKEAPILPDPCQVSPWRRLHSLTHSTFKFLIQMLQASHKTLSETFEISHWQKICLELATKSIRQDIRESADHTHQVLLQRGELIRVTVDAVGDQD